jgi:signal transduction histidine kinase
LRPILAAEPASELEEFVYIVSHDLRNSARALTEVPQWLRSDLEDQGVVLNSDMKEDFALLERHSERLDRMLLDLLAYSRVGRLQEICKVPVRHLIERVMDETAHADRIRVHYEPDLPSIVMGYKDGFVLFKCMIDNVVRHCPPVGNDLWIEAERQGDDVTLMFRDNGPGVDATELERIFKPMTSLRRRDEVEGSGMGLAIVHRIARQYNGTVAAGRDPNTAGLRVRVTLNDAGLVPYERLDMLDFDRDG